VNTQCGDLVTQRIVAALARQRRLTAIGRVVKIERVELVLDRRCDRHVAIAIAIRRGEYLVVDCPPLPIDRPDKATVVEIGGVARRQVLAHSQRQIS